MSFGMLPQIWVFISSGVALTDANAAIKCAGKHDEYKGACSAILDPVECESQIACFLVNSSSCTGDLAKFGATTYSTNAISFMLPKGKFFKAVTQRASEFQACTGVRINFLDSDRIGTLGWGAVNTLVNEDLGMEKCSLDISDRASKEAGALTCVVAPGLGLYDAYLIKTGWVADYANAKLVEPLNEFVVEGGVTLAWNDIQKSIRENLARYGDDIVVMPVDADFSTLLVREDALEAYRIETGRDIIGDGGFKTWESLIAFIHHMDQRDFDDDGSLDYASCLPLCSDIGFSYMALGGPLYMIYATMIQTLGITQGIHFDPETMKPLFDNEGFERALHIYRNLSYPCATSDLSTCRKREDGGAAYLQGKCIAYFSHPGPVNARVVGNPVGRKNSDGEFVWQPLMADGITYAESRRMGMPGSQLVVNRQTNKLVECNQNTCPLAVNGINRSPLINGGNTLAIRKLASNETKRALKDFFAYLNAPEQSVQDTATPGTWNNHWRVSHIIETAWPTHQALGWTRTEFEDLQRVTDDLGSSNPSLELRLRGYTDYVYNTFEPMLRKHFGYEEIIDENGNACLHVGNDTLQITSVLVAELTREWETITESFGRLEQLMRYRKSLGLPELTKRKICSIFEEHVLGQYECDSGCAIGTYFDSLRGSCEFCEAGTFAKNPGACQPCHFGEFQNLAGQTFCNSCEVGRFSESMGASECQACRVGTMTEFSKSSSCVDCPVGKFADAPGTPKCSECPIGMLTLTWSETLSQWLVFSGAADANACGCDHGAQLNDLGQCVECGIGLNCVGNGVVIIEKGYSSDGDLSVFDCFPDKDRCPGGMPGLCAYGRDNTSIACSKCIENLMPGPDGTCQKCGALDVLFAFFCSLLVLVALSCIYMFNAFGSFFNTGPVVLTMVATFGQFLSLLQSIGIIALIDIRWPKTVQGIYSLLQSFNLNLEIARIECAATMSSFSSYMLQVSVIFVGLAILCVIHMTRVIALLMDNYSGGHWRSLIGSCGTFMSMLFIAIVSITISPLQCYRHPNGKLTMRTHRDIVCWEGGHESFVIIGCCAMVLPLLFLAASFYVVVTIPRQLAHGNMTLLHSWSFLFVRYKPGLYLFAPITSVRNALIGIAPVLSSPLGQIIWLDTVVAASIILMLLYLPWRVPQANVVEICMSSVVLTILIVAGFFVGSDDEQILSFVVVVALIFAVAVMLLSIASVFFRFYLSKKPFKEFICHHKSGAAAFARLLKSFLQREHGRPKSVFIDSDDLKDLSHVFNIVAYQTEVFVILLSQEVLSRPWCLGEIATAHKRNVRMMIMKFPGVVFPGEQGFQPRLSDNRRVTIEGFVHYGISVDEMHVALQTLQNQFVLEIPDTMSKALVHAACKALIKADSKQFDDAKNKLWLKTQSLGSKWTSPNSSRIFDGKTTSSHSALSSNGESVIVKESKSIGKSKSLVSHYVCVAVDPSNLEAIASALVLEEFLSVHLTHNPEMMPHVMIAGESLECTITDLILICSAGVFHQPFVIHTLVRAASSGSTSLAVIVDPNFKVPHAATLKPGIDFYRDDDLDNDAVAVSIGNMFYEIAIIFRCSELNEMELGLKAEETAVRLCTRGRTKATFRPLASTGSRSPRGPLARERKFAIAQSEHSSGSFGACPRDFIFKHESNSLQGMRDIGDERHAGLHNSLVNL